MMMIFAFQGAERKNKDESKSAEKRIQKWVKQNTSACPGKIARIYMFLYLLARLKLKNQDLKMKP